MYKEYRIIILCISAVEKLQLYVVSFKISNIMYIEPKPLTWVFPMIFSLPQQQRMALDASTLGAEIILLNLIKSPFKKDHRKNGLFSDMNPTLICIAKINTYSTVYKIKLDSVKCFGELFLSWLWFKNYFRLFQHVPICQSAFDRSQSFRSYGE